MSLNTKMKKELEALSYKCNHICWLDKNTKNILILTLECVDEGTPFDVLRRSVWGVVTKFYPDCLSVYLEI